MTTQLTSLQIKMLENARDHEDPLRSVFGFQQRGGASMSLMSLQRKGLIHGNTITDAGREALASREATGMANSVRRVLREAGLVELGNDNQWGYTVTHGSRPGVVRVRYTSASPTSSTRIGNGRVSEYVRALQASGYDVRRVPGVTRVDSLLVQRKQDPASK